MSWQEDSGPGPPSGKGDDGLNLESTFQHGRGTADKRLGKKLVPQADSGEGAEPLII